MYPEIGQIDAEPRLTMLPVDLCHGKIITSSKVAYFWHALSLSPVSITADVYSCADNFVPLDRFFGPNSVDISTLHDCEWRIIAPSGSYQMRITYLDLPTSVNCSTHSLTVYGGLHGIPTKQIAKLCGQICEEQVITLDEQFAYVKLHLDTFGSFRGFQAIMTSR